MNTLRSIGAVIAGYLVFAVGAFSFFQISGQAPHEAAPVSIMAGSIVCGVAFALAGGYLAASLAKNRPAAHGLAVALVLALGATVSLVSTLGKGAIWTQISALLLMAPCAWLGGWLRSRQVAGR